jgi:hypothetical protein
MTIKNIIIIHLSLFFSSLVLAQNIKNNPSSNHGNKFEQLGTILPSANTYRTASGAPGHQYWQQRADYKIDVFLDEKDLRIHGEEQITYYNFSPDELQYLWLQLDENQHQPEGDANHFDESKINNISTNNAINSLDVKNNKNGLGVNIISVKDAAGKDIPFTINQTMMRIDLPKPLKTKQKYVFKIKWNYKMIERTKYGGRGGYEYFEGDGNNLFTITQWYPRMCVYSDYQGWNNKQFTGRGEFALVFGNYEVNMKVPADHVVAATGTCSNLSQVLTKEQLDRWHKAQNSNNPIEIVKLEEAKAREINPDKENFKTWKYKAENVRDFAWGSSRKFVWDAMGQKIENKNVMCMSYYPKESYALYRKYSTKVVAHTLRVYSKFTIPYPYPVAISVEASNGMEYPMICFNYGRTDQDGTYSARTKHGMIEVIIHEVGHNFFPMIINSDERQWSWMDEGLNTFVQFLAEQEFDNNYPSRRGPAHKITDYMKMPPDQLEPIMTNSENIAQFGNNAYGKPATALNILRETIMGRELFDHAFKEYSRRWAFKHPSPADFYRTMEDASGVDLDWFWRGWFYDIEPVDISLDSVKAFKFFANDTLPIQMDTIWLSNKKAAMQDDFIHISRIRNKQNNLEFLIDKDTSLRDFYYHYQPQETKTEKEEIEYVLRDKYRDLELLSDEESKKYENNFYYQLHLSNKGGLVMPVIIQWEYKDGTTEIEYINAYIWRKNEKEITKAFLKKKEVVSIKIDPYRETADIDESNNTWPKIESASKLEIFKAKSATRGTYNENNPMKKALKKVDKQ